MSLIRIRRFFAPSRRGHCRRICRDAGHDHQRHHCRDWRGRSADRWSVDRRAGRLERGWIRLLDASWAHPRLLRTRCRVRSRYCCCDCSAPLRRRSYNNRAATVFASSTSPRSIIAKASVRRTMWVSICSPASNRVVPGCRPVAKNRCMRSRKMPGENSIWQSGSIERARKPVSSVSSRTAVARIFARLDCPGGNLEQPAAHRQPVIADQADAIAVEDGDDGHGAGMLDDLAHVFASVRQTLAAAHHAKATRLEQYFRFVHYNRTLDPFD